MKKFALLLAAFCLSAALAGCSDAAQTTTATEAAKTTAATTTTTAVATTKAPEATTAAQTTTEFVYPLSSDTARYLTDEELKTINEGFTFFLENSEDVNPICYFLMSYYENPENMDIGKFVYYMTRESFPTIDDKAEIDALRAKGMYPFDDDSPEYAPVPFGRIPYATVEKYLQEYMGLTLADMKNMGDAMYLDEYETFYSYASDGGLCPFNAVSGEIDGDIMTLYNGFSKLVISRDNRILSFTEIQQ